MGPELGRAQYEHLQDLLIHNHPHPILHPAFHSYDKHETILREIERERIREEIILAEIARRRAIEAEVRRELMMQRESALQRGSNGFPFGSSQVLGLDSPLRLSLLATRAEGRSQEERISLSNEERPNGRREGGGFETPFQRGTADLRVLEVKPVQEEGKKKENIILLGKPDVNIYGSKRKAKTPSEVNVSGSKRKAETPPEVDVSEEPSEDILKKKAKEEWSCALCQVCATGEKGLSEHLQGKKHKAKEAALRAQRAVKNYSIGLFPKEDTEPIEVVQTVDPGRDDGVKIVAEDPSVKREDLPLMQRNPNSDDMKNQSEVVPKEQKNGKPMDKQFKFWCNLCHVGTHSQNIMNAHEKGKKHIKHLRESEQNGEACSSYNPIEKSVVDVSQDEAVAENEKKIASGTVDKVLDEVKSADLKLTDAALKPEDPEPEDESKSKDIGAMEIVEPEHADANKEENCVSVDPGRDDEVKIVAEEPSLKRDDLPPMQRNQNSDDMKNESEIVPKEQKNGKHKEKQFRFWCNMCRVWTHSQNIMNAHEKGKKHVKRVRESEQNGEACSSYNPIEKIVVAVSRDDVVAENEKKLAFGTVDEVLDEVKSADLDLTNAALKAGDPETEDESKSKDIGALEIVEPEHVDEIKEENCVAVDPGRDDGVKIVAEEPSLKRDDLPPMQRNPNSDDMKNQSEIVPKEQKKCKPMDKQFRFWCNMCHVGTHCQNIMNAHEKGKKHVKRLRESEQNGEACSSYNPIEKNVVALGQDDAVAENEKKIASGTVDKVLDEVKSADLELTDAALKPEYPKPEDEIKSKDIGALEIVELEHVDETKEENCVSVDPGRDDGVKIVAEEPSLKRDDLPLMQRNPNSDDMKNQSEVVPKEQKNGKPMDKQFKFWCNLCHVGTHSQNSMNAHEKGKKHIKRRRESEQNGEACSSYNPIEKNVVAVSQDEAVAENEEKIASGTVDKVRDEVKSADLELTDAALKPEDPEPEDESKSKDIGVMEIVEPEHVDANKEENCVAVDPGRNDGVKIVAEEPSLKRDVLPPMQRNPNSDDMKNQSEIVLKEQKNGEPKDKQFRFWCNMCHVVTYSQNIMNAHETGKKHVKRLRESEQNGEACFSYNPIEKIVVAVSQDELVAENEKKIASGTVVDVLDEVKSTDLKLTNVALKPEDPDPEDVSKSKDIGALEIVEPEHVDETKEENCVSVDPGRDDGVKIVAEEPSLKRDNLPLMQRNPNSDDMKNQSEVVPKEQKNGKPMDKQLKFWCNLCHVGTHSQNSMNAHEKGKKHVKRLRESEQNGEACSSYNPIEKIVVAVGQDDAVAENEKKIASGTVDKVLDEVKSADLELTDAALKPEDPKPEDEIKSKDIGALEIVEPEHVDETKEENCVVVDPGRDDGVKIVAEEPSLKRDDLPPMQRNPNLDDMKNQSEIVPREQKNGKPMDKQFRFWCNMCHVGTHSQNIMNAHEKGKKHVKRLRESEQNGEACSSYDPIEKIVVAVSQDEAVAENEEKISFSDCL